MRLSVCLLTPVSSSKKTCAGLPVPRAPSSASTAVGRPVRRTFPLVADTPSLRTILRRTHVASSGSRPSRQHGATDARRFDVGSVPACPSQTCTVSAMRLHQASLLIAQIAGPTPLSPHSGTTSTVLRTSSSRWCRARQRPASPPSYARPASSHATHSSSPSAAHHSPNVVSLPSLLVPSWQICRRSPPTRRTARPRLDDSSRRL
mmetsp:Transcript_10368/g.32803  ORF Transcript_10368/g.32803 Transcript_10368/m.32803 type:complete len:205 (+) Transcript_10368:396-1010(+)